MKKRVLFSISGIVVLVALGLFIFTQMSDSRQVQAGFSCEQAGTAMGTANVSSDCCSAAAEAKMTEAKGSNCASSTAVTATSVECQSIIQPALDAGCSGVQSTVSSSNCSGATKAVESAGCTGNKESEASSFEKLQVINASDTSCCEGSAEKALLADACCGNCI